MNLPIITNETEELDMDELIWFLSWFVDPEQFIE